MISGVVTEIYKKIYEAGAEKRHELRAEAENASHKYDKNYKDRHGQLKVFCVGMREPISLDDVYVGVQFLDEHTASRYRSREDLEQAFRQRGGRYFASTSDKRQDGTQVANEKKNLMLLGGPGVGKSTFLRKIGLEALKGKNGNFKHECIPVFLELKRFTEDQIDIEALIAEEFKTCGYPHPEQMTNAALESGKLLILFDGLDEVPTSNVDNVIDKIGDFVDQYSQNRFIASCRIAAYRGGFKHFTDVEMADFDDSQIQVYINNWFASTPDLHLHQLDEQMKTTDRCWETLNAEEHRATKELARNPLLLTLLCIVYNRLQRFPPNRADLYEKALNVFLEEWAAEKRVNQDALMNQGLSIADEMRMLSEIAAKNFDENRFFFRKNELIDQIKKFGEASVNTPSTFNASKILDTILIDQGIFVERVRGFYSFSHLTFQEYLTANYVTKDTRSVQGLVKRHLHDPQWREVFLLTSGLIHEANDLLKAMEAEAAKSINTDGLKALLRWTKRITNISDARYEGVIKRAFVITEYSALWLLNQIYQGITLTLDQYLDLHSALSFDQYFEIHPEFHLDQVLAQERSVYLNIGYAFSFLYEKPLYEKLDFYSEGETYEDLNFDFFFSADQYPKLHLYLTQTVDLDVTFYQYLDFYQYTDADFYAFAPSKLGSQLDRELDERISLVKRMEQTKIFKGVNLHWMIQRLNAQREYIKVAGKGKSVEPPRESIHDAWLSVLNITDEMLAISREELENCLQYFRVVDLIVACKAAAGRVSPKVWREIESRLLIVDAADIKA
ncbi:MAG: NACHT domain-containing protein [Candidatus Poribacteria bacterium]|nr:NACHT domain-containing protein [Candidatus Poribacteria bacterium]